MGLLEISEKNLNPLDDDQFLRLKPTCVSVISISSAGMYLIDNTWTGVKTKVWATITGDITGHCETYIVVNTVVWSYDYVTLTLISYCVILW